MKKLQRSLDEQTELADSYKVQLEHLNSRYFRNVYGYNFILPQELIAFQPSTISPIIVLDRYMVVG